MVQVPPALAQSNNPFALPQPSAGKASSATGKPQQGQAIESEDLSAKQLEKLQQAVQHIQTSDEHAHGIASGSSISNISIFHKNPANEIIDDAMNRSMAKYPGSQRDALNGFHKEISRMTQDQLDGMKDTIVKRMSSDESSQWDRDLLQKMYDITDAVAEHRPAPHIEGKDPWGPINIKPGGPINIKPGFPPGKPPINIKPNFPGEPSFPLHPHEKDPFQQNLFKGESGGGPINNLGD